MARCKLVSGKVQKKLSSQQQQCRVDMVKKQNARKASKSEKKRAQREIRRCRRAQAAMKVLLPVALSPLGVRPAQNADCSRLVGATKKVGANLRLQV